MNDELLSSDVTIYSDDQYWQKCYKKSPISQNLPYPHTSDQPPSQHLAGMERHQIDRAAAGIVAMQAGRHGVGLAHQGDRALVER